MALGPERTGPRVTIAVPEPHAISSATLMVRDAVRESGASRIPLRIVGSGGWLDAGRPVPGNARPLVLAPDAGIVDYVPGDLTLTARAGTTLGTIAAVTAAEGQRLALDPFGADSGTLGATISTASYGPLGQMFGGPRDNVLGIEFVTGSGTVARGGGRVVKNVAGFDLTRLLTGSWGTLGVITEATLRLRSLPERDETIAMVMPDDPAKLAERVERARVAPAAPWALELVNATLARQLGVGHRTVLLARLGGNSSVVASQRETFATIGDHASVGSDVWSQLRVVEPVAAVVFRLSDLPSRLATTWQAAVRCASPFPGALIHATVGRGVVRCIVPLADAEDGASGTAAARDRGGPVVRALGAGSPTPGRIFERLPAHLWPVLAPATSNDRLSRGVREAYDPHGILNPGILGG